MEVDRVSQMGGVGRDRTPAWTREKMRPRKFVEEVEAAESETEEAAQDAEETDESAAEEEGRGGRLNVVA